MTWQKKLGIFSFWLFTAVTLSYLQLTNTDHSCNFDYGLCSNWSQSIQDDFNWTNWNGPTISSNTGPSSDYSGNGSYMYIETSSPREFGDTAKLVFSVPSSDVGKLSCLRFYYHMYGDTINTLNVYNGNTTVFTKWNNQGDFWLTAKINMILESNIIFEGIRGQSFTGDIAIDEVSIADGVCPECMEKVDQSFGRLSISYSSQFKPYCNWILGNTGIDQAFAFVSIRELHFSGYSSEYIKIFDGNGTEVSTLPGPDIDSACFNNSFQYIPFGESKNITIQVSLILNETYVKIDYGILERRLDSASVLSGWNVIVVNKTAKSIGITWSPPPVLLDGGIRFYVALARKVNSGESSAEIMSNNTGVIEITGLLGYTEYNVSVVAVDGYGIPFKSTDAIVMTDEGVPCRAPYDVRLTRFNRTSDLLVDWDQIPQHFANGKILGYTIFYKENNFDRMPFQSVNSSGQNNTQITLKGLKRAHQYFVAVAAFTSKGEGQLSDYVSATTGCYFVVNETFGQIELTAPTDTDLHCSWKIQSAGISDAVAFLAVQELNLFQCSEFLNIMNGNGSEALYHLGCGPFAAEILADVPFGLSNNISIQLYTETGNNNIKMKFAILKNGLTSAIQVLGWNVTVVNLTPTSLTLQWTDLDEVVNHSAKFYIVEVKSTQGIILTAETVPGNTTATLIKGIRPSTSYHVIVFGIDDIGQPYKSLESVTATNEVFCGSRPMISSRIVGGTTAAVNSWPWQVMLTDNYGRQFCGGSLVDPDWVLTAAHCVYFSKSSSVKIRLGAHYAKNGSVGTEQFIGVAKIIMHENYGFPLLDSNDIALIKLTRTADIGVGVGLVCLPDNNHQLPFDDVNKKCWISGWGTLSFGGSSPNTLMQAAVPLVSNNRCVIAYPDKIDHSMLCAGQDEGGIDACQGDSGGPLVCEFNGTWYLEGATSWGYGCAEPNFYGVYAKVRIFKSWLALNMHTDVSPSVLPQNQSSSALVSCNFEHGLCSGWNQSSTDDFDWTLGSGSTPSSSTGPSNGKGGSGKYMYIEASSPRKPGESAKLVVTIPSNGNPACLSFYYHMYGASAGALNVYSGKTEIFSVAGNQENNWLLEDRNINLDGMVTFEGIVGSSYTGDVAIDQVNITEGRCPVSKSCDFDNGLCVGWEQSISDVFDWTRQKGPTPSNDTGPKSDHTTGLGYYMYIEASSPRIAGDNAKLELAVYGNGELSCLTFYYHMYGDGMGTLNVYSGEVVVFNASGDHGSTWIEAKRTIYLKENVTFEGIVGSSQTGDLAIDDVSISNGSCQVYTATPTLSPTSTFAPSPSIVSGISTINPSTEKPSLFPSPTVQVISSTTSTPKPPSLEEKQESVLFEIRDFDIKKWNEQSFRAKVAKAATDYCAVNRTECHSASTSSRRKRSSNNLVFTSDMVHILPGYPKTSPDDPLITLIAFYLQLPQGFSNTVVNKNVLIDIIKNNKSNIEGSLGTGTILSVKPLPSTEDDDDEEKDDDDEEKSIPISALIGASLGGLFLVIVVVLLLSCKKSNSDTNRRETKNTKNDNSNDAYLNYGYYIGSGERAVEMPRENGTYSSINAKPNEQRHDEINNPTNPSTMTLKLPEATSKGDAASIYQQLDSGAAASTNQSLNSAPKLPEASAECISEVAAAKSTNGENA